MITLFLVFRSPSCEHYADECSFEEFQGVLISFLVKSSRAANAKEIVTLSVRSILHVIVFMHNHFKLVLTLI